MRGELENVGVLVRVCEEKVTKKIRIQGNEVPIDHYWYPKPKVRKEISPINGMTSSASPAHVHIMPTMVASHPCCLWFVANHEVLSYSPFATILHDIYKKRPLFVN